MFELFGIYVGVDFFMLNDVFKLYFWFFWLIVLYIVFIFVVELMGEWEICDVDLDFCKVCLFCLFFWLVIWMILDFFVLMNY